MRAGALTFLVGIVLVGLGVVGQVGLPDLVVKSVRVFPGDLEEGQEALVRTVIANQGQGDAVGNFDVIVELDGWELAVRSFFELRKEKTIEISIPWKAIGGTHTVTVFVDGPFSRIRESNESNNKFSSSFVVSPVMGVRSLSLDMVKLFGRTLDETGKALHFKLTNNVLTSLDNAVRAITEAAVTLRTASIELELVRKSAPPAFNADALYQDAGALVTLYEAIAHSFERIAAMLSIGNFDAVLENGYILRQKLIELSQKTLADTSFAPLRSAVIRFERVIALAQELRNLLRGAQGRSQYEVAVELFTAFMAFGDELSICAQALVQSAQAQAARFHQEEKTLISAYSTKYSLEIWWPRIILMRLEIYNPTSGDLLFSSEEMGPWLGITANGSLTTGTYAYRLVGITKHGVRRVELGRLQIKHSGSLPPLVRQYAPVGMAGGH